METGFRSPYLNKGMTVGLCQLGGKEDLSNLSNNLVNIIKRRIERYNPISFSQNIYYEIELSSSQ